MRLPIAILLTLVAAAPAIGAETAWQTIAPGVSLRLISTGQVKPDGTTWVGLELDMPEDTKTYWRVPGDTGIPIQLDFTGSVGVSDHAIAWPYPTRVETPDYVDYVYYGPTLLPVELGVSGDAPTLDLAVVLGVCSEICIPAQAKFSLPLAGQPDDMPNGLRIRQAVATSPMDWTGSAQSIGAVRFDAAAQALAVTIDDPAIDPASLIAATQDGVVGFGVPQKGPESNLVLLPVLGKTDAKSLENTPIQLTFMTATGAFEVWRTLAGRHP